MPVFWVQGWCPYKYKANGSKSPLSLGRTLSCQLFSQGLISLQRLASM
ncbi:hypothetical protein MC7420_4613 [Coleofasciculus chthonoplastes PCC 7420]|uniref:Uncharacterized protein n=1 Tax=Coleofasciculus chthonoplastes PCC 7420 TaxID=118168 RepID=B4VNA5_9CYAN|nr:hypothetical protein MC7420_4613 [Coleofasciculus chthonoplastes PCC 7420]